MSKKLIFSIIFLILILGLSIWAFTVATNITKSVSEADIQASRKKIDKSKNENVNAKGVIITETEAGKKFWEIYADSGKYDSKTTLVSLVQVKGNFYKNNKVVLSFDAPFGKYNQKSKGIILTGGARALSNKDIFISAKKLVFKGKTDEITATGNVKIKKSDEMMTLSDKSVFDTSFKWLKNFGNAQAFVYKKN